MSFIETFSGVRFEPLAPVPSDIRICDIAHALSNQCRFSGHTISHYSVAEHSVRVSLLLREWKVPLLVQLWGLLHDASEAYLVDLPTPLKQSEDFGAVYRGAEARLMHAVCRRFDLPLEEPQVVRDADAKLLATEVRDLMPARPEHWGKLTTGPLPVHITPWNQFTAEREFLRRFSHLTGIST